MQEEVVLYEPVHLGVGGLEPEFVVDGFAFGNGIGVGAGGKLDGLRLENQCKKEKQRGFHELRHSGFLVQCSAVP